MKSIEILQPIFLKLEKNELTLNTNEFIEILQTEIPSIKDLISSYTKAKNSGYLDVKFFNSYRDSIKMKTNLNIRRKYSRQKINYTHQKIIVEVS